MNKIIRRCKIRMSRYIIFSDGSLEANEKNSRILPEVASDVVGNFPLVDFSKKTFENLVDEKKGEYTFETWSLAHFLNLPDSIILSIVRELISEKINLLNDPSKCPLEIMNDSHFLKP